MRYRPIIAAAGLAVAGLASPAHAAGPETSVTPKTEVNPDGQDLAITGSGFDPNKNNKFGIYVGFGPKTADYATNAGIFQSTKWVHLGATPSAGQDELKADGSFSTTLTGIKAKYTDGNGTAVDCLVTQCYIITIAAHGVPDRTQDTFTPITFKGADNGGGGEEPGNPGTGGITEQQTLTAKITAGGTLALKVAGANVGLSDAKLGGHATGALNKATVTDTRGTNAGWSLVGQVSDFTSPEGGTIPGANLAWGPNAAVVGDGSGGQVTAGAPAMGLNVARTLGSSQGGVSGGVFELGAGLDLKVPAGVPVGSYTGTLTLTLS